MNVCVFGVKGSCVFGVKGSCVFGVKGSCVFGVKGSCVFGVKGSCVFGVKGSCVFGVKGSCVFGVKGSCVFGVKGSCVFGVKGSCVFASTVSVEVWIAVYLTSYSDCLTGFREPLLPPCLGLSLRFEKLSSIIVGTVSGNCDPSISLAGAATSIIFVATNILL